MFVFALRLVFCFLSAAILCCILIIICIKPIIIQEEKAGNGVFPGINLTFFFGNLLVGRVCTMDKFRHKKISPSRIPDTCVLFRVIGKQNRSGVFPLVLFELLLRLDHPTLGNAQQRFKRTLL
eukprot:TRINITY_DN19990_c0_g1_i1.p1 TRINITY_DN19990_c0_g1~~TRINITY_DN19990_c0_g1_i1.p1  ORF type:complete len:123 (-),score=12.30 TRINITY_DN19990_c0_g1_i1:1431-1799(-)